MVRVVTWVSPPSLLDPPLLDSPLLDPVLVAPALVPDPELDRDHEACNSVLRKGCAKASSIVIRCSGAG